MSADDRVDELVARWYEAYRRGQLIPVKELCANCPDLIEKVGEEMDFLMMLEKERVEEKASPPQEKSGTRTVPWFTGQMVGDYKLLERLDKGGAGVVWKAEGPGPVTVALKRVNRKDGLGERETRALEKLGKNVPPNIHLLHVHRFWQEGDDLILVTAWANGGNLRDHQLKCYPKGMPPRPLLEYMRQAAAGIDFLNEKCGILHGDVKPKNFLLMSGAVVVGDFGLMKALEDSPAVRTWARSPRYAAPEQEEGRFCSQTDQFGLAASYVELRTSELKRIPPDCTTIDLSQLGMAEEAVVAKALSKNPDDRFKNCTAFVNTLAESLAATILPQIPDPYFLFTGRKEILKELQQVLPKAKRAALWGEGGMGKTQIALQFAQKGQNLDQYKTILWVNASPEMLESSFANLAQELDDPPVKADQDNGRLTAGVKRWLEAHAGWLLILDNAVDLVLVRKYLPAKQANGHVLLTTWDKNTHAIAFPIEVPKMPPKEGALLLLRRAGLVGLEESLEDATPEDCDHAIKIASKSVLDGLPLALNQAGAFIGETKCLPDFLDLYRSEGEKVRKRGDRTDPNPHSVATIWELSFRKIEETNRAAADLLRCCAFLAPDAIPEEIFTTGAAHLGDYLGPAAGNRFESLEAIATAGKFSLIRRNSANKTLTIHRLVQEVQRDRMSGLERRDWAERVVGTMEGGFEVITDHENVPLPHRILPHAITAAQLVSHYQLKNQQASRLLQKLGHHFMKECRFAEAEPFLQKALTLDQQLFGPKHFGIVHDLIAVAMVQEFQGRYDEAESLLRQALGIVEGVGDDNPLTGALILTSLAKLYRNQGKYQDAEQMYERVISILGPELSYPQSDEVLFSLAFFYLEQRKYADAERLLKRALEICEEWWGPEHLKVAEIANCLASFYHKYLHKADQAELFYQRALAIRESALGSEHPDVATDLFLLATIYSTQGKFAEAEKFHQRALNIRVEALGSEHPDVAMSLNNLAMMYKDQGFYFKAEEHYERALAIHENVYGAEDPLVATVLNNLGSLNCRQGKFTQAEARHKRALKILEHAHGTNHFDTCRTRARLAVLYGEQGRYPEAEQLCRMILPLFETELGSDHPETKEIRILMTAVLHAQRKVNPPSRRSSGAARGFPNVSSGAKSYSIVSGKEQQKGKAPRVGRNKPCPCGSGQKFKNCCGRLRKGY